MTTDGFIQVRNLNKRFVVRKKREKGSAFREKETIEALRDVSFEIGQGELIGYIGPNGAGKSTTVKILSGILTPDGGEALVGGQVPWKDRKSYVKHIGVVFGQRMQLWWDVPIIDSFSLLKDIYRVPEEAYRRRLKELTEAGEFRDLRGMLYFTDGYGTYPAKRPPWETAFIFMEEDYSDKGVPPWAIRLVLSREDLEKDEEEDAPFLPGTDYHFISEGEDLP